MKKTNKMKIIQSFWMGKNLFMRTYLYLFALLMVGFSTVAQTKYQENHRLIVTLEQAPFDSLFLLEYTNEEHILFPGEKTGKFTWTFEIPDSIVDHSELMNLEVAAFDTISNTSTSVRFVKNVEGKDMYNTNISLEDKVSYIRAKYKDQTVLENEPFNVKIEEKDSIIMGDFIIEDFELTEDDVNTHMVVRAKEPYFSWFMSFTQSDLTYDEYLSKYIELSKEYPDSKYLLTNLASNLNNYQSKDDVRLIYNNLSKKHSSTKWMKKTESFLQNQFQNIELPNIVQKEHQKVIQDEGKFNLVVFTASWCGPCKEQIPILKQMHEEFEEELVITYISLDGEKDIPTFEQQLEGYEIPWRSLYAYEILKEIEAIYFINGIPHNIWVRPDGSMEILDVRVEEDRKGLYEELNVKE